MAKCQQWKKTKRMCHSLLFFPQYRKVLNKATRRCTLPTKLCIAVTREYTPGSCRKSRKPMRLSPPCEMSRLSHSFVPGAFMSPPSLLSCPVLVQISLCKRSGYTFPLISFYSNDPVLFFPPFHFGLYFPILRQCREEVKAVHLELGKKQNKKNLPPNSKLTIPNSKWLGESKRLWILKTWLQTINQKHLS